MLLAYRSHPLLPALHPPRTGHPGGVGTGRKHAANPPQPPLHLQPPKRHLPARLWRRYIWEAPNWSPDGKYLISNSGGGIYKIVLKPDGTGEPQRLAAPAAYRCNNDKALSPDGRQLAFSATLPPGKSSQVFLADADGTSVKLMVADSPSYFHGWSPDSKTLAFVAQRNGSGQYDVYRVPATGGPEERLTSDPQQEDGPDYSPDGRWIYINADRSGKQAIWRFPANGAGSHEALSEKVVDDGLEDWFPHLSPDGTKLLYIGYPAGTATHNPRDVKIQLKLVAVDHDHAASTPKTLVEATGGQGSLNVKSWAPDSTRFAYVTYEASLSTRLDTSP